MCESQATGSITIPSCSSPSVFWWRRPSWWDGTDPPAGQAPNPSPSGCAESCCQWRTSLEPLRASLARSHLKSECSTISGHDRFLSVDKHHHLSADLLFLVSNWAQYRVVTLTDLRWSEAFFRQLVNLFLHIIAGQFQPLKDKITQHKSWQWIPTFLFRRLQFHVVGTDRQIEPYIFFLWDLSMEEKLTVGTLLL